MTIDQTYILLLQLIEEQGITTERVKQWRSRNRLPRLVWADLCLKASQVKLKPDVLFFEDFRAAEQAAKERAA